MAVGFGTIPLGEASQCLLYHVQKLLFGFSCSLLETETSLLPKCLSHVPVCPSSYRSVFVIACVLNGKASGQAVPGPGSCVGCSRKGGKHCLCHAGPMCAHPAELNLKLVLSLGSQCRKPQPLILLPLTWGCVELTEIILCLPKTGGKQQQSGNYSSLVYFDKNALNQRLT